MYPYTKKLTLVEALRLFHSEIQFTVISSTSKHCADFDENTLKEYYNDGNYISCTALDYATHILNQAAPPEGWGYAAYELSSGRYDELPYYTLIYGWEEGAFYCYKESDDFEKSCDFSKSDWNSYAFSLKDLARVEGIPETEIATDWKAKYKDLEIKKNNLASDFALLQDNFDRREQQINSLKLQVEEAKRLVDLKQDKIEALEKANKSADDYINALLNKLNVLRQLKIADIELEKASSNYYPF